VTSATAKAQAVVATPVVEQAPKHAKPAATLAMPGKAPQAPAVAEAASSAAKRPVAAGTVPEIAAKRSKPADAAGTHAQGPGAPANQPVAIADGATVAAAARAPSAAAISHRRQSSSGKQGAAEPKTSTVAAVRRSSSSIRGASSSSSSSSHHGSVRDSAKQLIGMVQQEASVDELDDALFNEADFDLADEAEARGSEPGLDEDEAVRCPRNRAHPTLPHGAISPVRPRRTPMDSHSHSLAISVHPCAASGRVSVEG